MQEKETVRKLKHGDQEAFAFYTIITGNKFIISQDSISPPLWILRKLCRKYLWKVWESHHFFG